MIRISRRRALLAGGLTLAAGFFLLYLVSDRDLGSVPLIDGTTASLVRGIHLVGNLGPSAAYAIETSEGLVLIDSGLEENAVPLKIELERLTLDWRTTRAIFLTHAHGDHTGGANRLREETGARVYAGKADATFIQDGGPRESIFSTYRMPDHDPHPTAVDVALEGGETFEFGDVRITAIAAPGHTPGSVCYLLERGRLRVLFSGDVIMHLGPRPLGTYSAYLAPRFRGDARSFLETLRSLRQLPVPDLILPGHPRDNARPESPQLTQSAWELLLDDGIREMQKHVKRLDADGAEYLDGHPRELLKGLYYLGDINRHAIYALSNDAGLFLFNAPGGSGTVEFIRRQLEELQVEPRKVMAILLTGATRDEIAGLREIVAHTKAQVVVSRSGIDAVREVCPPETTIISTAELAERGWFSVESLQFAGPGSGTVAYVVRLQTETVVISGRVPAPADVESQLQLSNDLSAANAEACRASLQHLLRVKPDVWLPAMPIHDQNANLYDDSWRKLIERNLRTASGLFP